MDLDDNNTSSDSTMVNLLRQILEVLQTSTIAEERGKDSHTKFWAAYKKVSGEYDDDMLERCNGNMDIVLIFAGLFSAVNTAFIIAIQPNPVDTTNALIFQLMQITLYGPSAAQPMILSPSTGYSSSTVWTQALAYASLALSLAAAFGAVLGKQWLGYYKTNRYGRGSLEARCKQRHRKFLGLEGWRFEGVLQSFPVLLQLSLFLFGLSLGAAMWTQQQIISMIIIATTAAGALCYACTILVSLRSPDCPFQSPVSLAIRPIFHPASAARQHNDENSTASAMQWILETSTNPDVVMPAFALMLDTNLRGPNVNITFLSGVAWDMFKACFDSYDLVMYQDYALALGNALINMSRANSAVTHRLRELTQEWEHWSSWRRLFLPWALEQCNASFRRMKETVSADPRHQADTRAALRVALGAGVDRFVNPDQEYVELVWKGQFESEIDPSDVDWLMECATHFNKTEDFGAAGDALLLLNGQKPSSISQTSIIPFLRSSRQSVPLRHSALRAACRVVSGNSPIDQSFSEAVLTATGPPIQHNTGDLFANAIRLLEVTEWSEYSNDLIGSPLIDIQYLVFLVLPVPKPNDTREHIHYYHALIRYIVNAHTRDDKRTVLRVAYRIRQELAGITTSRVPLSVQNEVLSKLSPALLTTVDPQSFDANNDYFCLIFTLTRDPMWLRRLHSDSHIERCIRIIPDFCQQPSSSVFHLAGIFLHFHVAYPQAAVLLRSITSSRWWDLTRMAWHIAGRQDSDGSDPDVLDDGIDILKALVDTTRLHIPQNASTSDLEFLHDGLGGALTKLESRQPPPSMEILSAIKDLKRYKPS